MTQAPSLDFDRLLKRFGGTAGLHARLARSDYAPAISAVAVRVWKTRGGVPAQFVLPVLLLLRDEGEDIWAYVVTAADVEEVDPFEGLTL